MGLSKKDMEELKRMKKDYGFDDEFIYKQVIDCFTSQIHELEENCEKIDDDELENRLDEISDCNLIRDWDNPNRNKMKLILKIFSLTNFISKSLDNIKNNESEEC